MVIKKIVPSFTDFFKTKFLSEPLIGFFTSKNTLYIEIYGAWRNLCQFLEQKKSFWHSVFTYKFESCRLNFTTQLTLVHRI